MARVARHRSLTRSPGWPDPAGGTATSRTAPLSPTTLPTKSTASTRSISAVGFAEWLDTKINLIDTPGYLDYFGEVVTGLHAADAAVVVVSGTGGVEVGTEKVWEVCDHLHLPRMLFVSMMDKEHADFERVYQDIQAHLTPKVVPVEIPIGDGPAFHGIINLFSGHCHNYKKGTAKSEYDVVPIPEEYQRRYQDYSEQLTEAVASTDDELIERYLGGEEIPREQFIGAVKRAMLAGQIVPLFCGSATLTYGLRTLLKKMVELLPSPAEVRPPVEAPLVGRVFKTLSEAHVGDVTLFRLYAGELRNGQRGVERGARGGGEAEPPVHPAGQGADRGGAAAARATSARWPSCATRTPATPSAIAISRCDSRRYRCPRRWRPPPCW